MKTFNERRESVAYYVRTIQKRRRRTVAAVTSVCLLAIILTGVLFVPYDRSLPDVSKHAGSDYYHLIQRLNEMTYQPPRYNNNFDALKHQFSVGLLSKGETRFPNMEAPEPNGTVAGIGTPSDIPDGGQQYQEVTDNQVSGVVEADLIKRSDKYVYYLRGYTLSVYSIAGEASTQVGAYAVEPFPKDAQQADWKDFSYLAGMEMYLSMDCQSVILVIRGYSNETGSCTILMQLDVSDPGNIVEKEKVYFLGDYISSRMVDGSILLSYNYHIDVGNIDFDDPVTFVPSYGVPENMDCISGEQILCPENAGSTNYTVLCKVDGNTLEVEGSVALLSYSQEIYVSEDTIYATFSYGHNTEKDENGNYASLTMTRVTGISYAGDSLDILGTIDLEGRVKDQYSMDQFDGVLRVVTSTNQTNYYYKTFAGESYMSSSGSKRNVNLYCVNLTDWTVKASVIGFAPEGEDAQSVRFDGYDAYVCTAEVITITDPVYYFDLSDLSSITWKDTGTIDGYSTSLIQLGDGYLMGIGYNEMRTLKIEVYEETADGVKPVCSYEPVAFFSENYKAYFIDREKALIGLHMDDMTRGRVYCLIHFDGYQLTEIQQIPMQGSLDHTRAFCADGWFYIFSDDGSVFFFFFFFWGVGVLWGGCPPPPLLFCILPCGRGKTVI